MTTTALWDEITTNPLQTSRVFGQQQIVISRERFEEFHEYFKPQFALFSPYENYRSSDWYRHIHAIKHNDTVQLHIDHYNPTVSFWLNIPHGFADVLPYLLWCAVHRKKPFKI